MKFHNNVVLPTLLEISRNNKGYWLQTLIFFNTSMNHMARYPAEDDGLCIGFEKVYLIVDFSRYTVGLVYL